MTNMHYRYCATKIRIRRSTAFALMAPSVFALLLNSEVRAGSVDYADPAVVSAETAVKELSVHVTEASNPAALHTAFLGYYRYRAAHPERVRNPYLYYVDLGLDNQTPRGYVFEMSGLKLVEGPFTVAHGRGSSANMNGVPDVFSNVSGSNASSLGLYLAGSLYSFSGKSGGRSYTSTGLRLTGESGKFNDAAYARRIVAHGAPYVTSRGAGRSEGCPAMEPARAARLLPKLANGGVVFLYSPNDARWRREDPWVSKGKD